MAETRCISSDLVVLELLGVYFGSERYGLLF